jgi:DNA-binding transcriptional MerR regulator
MTAPEIPEKLYYSIGEVKKIAGVEPYVLRFWESEFPVLRPRKNKKGHRTYRKRDIELILKIKELLYENKFTIPGAREILSGKRPAVVPRRSRRRKAQPEPAESVEMLADVHRELTDLIGFLEREKSEDIFEE